MSDEVQVVEHELGYAIEGTPADCTVAGIESLCPDVDMVVAGCNKGANLGAYVLGRSGTVSAAVEAAFFDVPAIAVSLYVPLGRDGSNWQTRAEEIAAYREAVRATTYLVRHAPGAGVFEQAEYLNVNVPLPAEEPAEMAITRPSLVYEMTASHEGGAIRLHDRIWERMREGDIPDPEGTDRRAIVDGKISVSPLTAPHTVQHHESLDGLAETFPASVE
jgi:5'-nucleotidase